MKNAKKVVKKILPRHTIPSTEPLPTTLIPTFNSVPKSYTNHHRHCSTNIATEVLATRTAADPDVFHTQGEQQLPRAKTHPRFRVTWGDPTAFEIYNTNIALLFIVVCCLFWSWFLLVWLVCPVWLVWLVLPVWLVCLAWSVGQLRLT